MVLFAGCGSLEHPDFFASGHDTRTYNAQTGRYEWPDDASRKPRPRPPRDRANDARQEAAPDDGRVFNPQTGRFERTDG